MTVLIVHDNPKRFPFDVPSVEVVAARDYLTQPWFSTLRGAKVFNLCRSYKYQTVGYYVSLLAAARGHRPLPSIATIQDLRLQPVIRVASQDLDKLMQQALRPLKSNVFELSVYFGRNLATRYDRLSLALFNQFPAPFFRAVFKHNEDRWELDSVRVISANEVPEDHRDFVLEQAKRYFARPLRRQARKPSRYDLAILRNDEEELPPSDDKAIDRFTEAAEGLGFRVETIGRDAYGRLSEFDALFIRETTSVNHHTFRFARRATAEGLVVIDDPDSILKCTNKVYVTELLERHRLRTPKTVIISKDTAAKVEDQIGFPCVVKRPDGSFSSGVVKFESREEFENGIAPLFEESELVIAQEFVPTNFDWRVGVINGEPLYACRYYMARKHWQIVKRDGSDIEEGTVDTLAIEDAPPEVVSIGVRAAKLIGAGLYGVDIKEVHGKPAVIEINDNPSIDAGFEDRVLGRDLYRRIMREFADRLEARRNGGGETTPNA
ncbi:MAG: RimK family protein [Phycisphaerales bacterium]